MFIDPRDFDENRSAKMCDAFLQACENHKYGWQWECPNQGQKCSYTHALPEGYVLKSTLKALEILQREQYVEKPIEDLIEEERAALKADECTPVTKETFFAWKKKKEARLEKERLAKLKTSEKKKMVGMSGRALFKMDPNMFKDGDGVASDDEEESKEAKPVYHEFKDVNQEKDIDNEIERVKAMGIEEDLFNDDELDDVDLDDLDAADLE